MAQLTSIPGLQEALAAVKAGSLDGRAPDADGRRGTYLDLPFTQEFRGEITEATFKHSQAGNEGIRFVITITDDGGDGKYVGQKVWTGVYFTGHAMQAQILATLVGCCPLGHTATDTEGVAKVLPGGKLVFALKAGNDPRYPEPRWLNIDIGQKLNMRVKSKDDTSVSKLTATLPVAASQAATPSAVAQAPAPAPVVYDANPTQVGPADGGVRPVGLKLPGQG